MARYRERVCVCGFKTKSLNNYLKHLEAHRRDERINKARVSLRHQNKNKILKDNDND